MSQAAITLSERADELEEQMMHELNEKIATCSPRTRASIS